MEAAPSLDDQAMIIASRLENIDMIHVAPGERRAAVRMAISARLINASGSGDPVVIAEVTDEYWRSLSVDLSDDQE